MKVVIIALFVVGVYLRLWNLSKAPLSLFGDEVDVGLQAYSILTTGKDYMGNNFPVIFRSFAEHRLPMQLYMSVPFINIFGLNELGVRGASVLMGFLSILGMYFLTKEIFGKRVSVIATLLLLFSPWHFVFSRQANDTGFLLPFTLFGTLFFIKGLKNYKYFLLSAFIWGLGIYSYATYSLFAPLFIFSISLINFHKLKKYSFKKLFLAVFLGILVINPYIYQSIKGTTTERVSNISVLTKEELVIKVAEGRKWVRGFWGEVFYNKYTVTASELFKNYSRSLSLNFLFSEGDPNLRHNIGGLGQLYAYEIATVLIGIFTVIKFSDKKHIKFYLMFLLWLAIAPIPSILTKSGGTHAARLILMLPPLVIFSALGINTIINSNRNFAKVIFLISIMFIAIFNMGNFFYKYFFIWPNESWRFWHYGFEETINIVKSIESDYEKIYFNNTYEPMLPRFLFYYEYDMDEFHEQFNGDVHIEDLEEGFDGFQLGDKYYFGDLKKPVERLAKPGNLVIASGEKDITNPGIFDNPDLRLLNVIVSPYKDSIFYVFTGN